MTDLVQQVELFDQISMLKTTRTYCNSALNWFVTLVGRARLRLPSRLELMEESLMSEATLAESESRSSLDSALLEGREVGLRFQPPTPWNSNKEPLHDVRSSFILMRRHSSWDSEQPAVIHQILLNLYPHTKTSLKGHLLAFIELFVTSWLNMQCMAVGFPVTSHCVTKLNGRNLNPGGSHGILTQICSRLPGEISVATLDF